MDVRNPLSGKKPRKLRGAYSLMNSADPIDTGTATTTAIRAMTTDPYKADSTPNWGWAPVVTKPVVVKNFQPAARQGRQGLKEEEEPDQDQDEEGEAACGLGDEPEDLIGPGEPAAQPDRGEAGAAAGASGVVTVTEEHFHVPSELSVLPP